MDESSEIHEEVSKVYTIALCDDEPRELERIEQFLSDYQEAKAGTVCQSRRFKCAEDLLSEMREEKLVPDLVLLDILMPEKNGIEAAAELRRMGSKVPIIFLTTSREYALRAYGVDAMQYLVKPLEHKRFFHVMDAAMEQMQRQKGNRIVIKVKGGIRQMLPDDIVYCESQRNYQGLYLLAEECRCRMTTGELWSILNRFPQFVRCGCSYILNMDHIISVQQRQIRMDNGSVIYIPQNKASEFKKEYFSYYFS